MAEESVMINGGHPEPITVNKLYLAKWSTRFWAWLIDFILVFLFLNIVRDILKSVWHISQFWEYWLWNIADFTIISLIFFVYWIISEGYCGQSIGKMVMNVKVVRRDGTKIKYGIAAIESLGKAFLLPFDCLIGWFGMPGTKLRLFNRISHTVVIKTDYQEPDGIIYVKEKE